MTEETRSTIDRIISTFVRSNAPKKLDHAETCSRRCPHAGCRKCLAFSEHGVRTEVPVLRSFVMGTEKIYEFCPFCHGKLGSGLDPNRRNLRRNTSRMFERLRQR